ncbi:MAG: PAS domain S-box protein [Betaproteobacteria bacterium]
MALWRRIAPNAGFIAFMLLFVVSVAGGVAYNVLRLRAEAIATSLDIGAMYAHVFEDHLTQSFKLIDVVLTRTVDEDADLKSPRIGGVLEKALRQTPALRSISIIDEEGRIVASTNPLNLGKATGEIDALPPRSDSARLMHFGRAWSGRDFADGSPVAAESGAKAAEPPGFLPVLRDFRIGGRRFMLLAAVNPDYFINNFSLKLAAEEGFVEVLRYDGWSLFTTQEHYPPGSRRAPKIFPSGSEVETGSFEEKLPNDIPVLTSFRASSEFPLVVVTHLYRDRALKKWAEETRLLILVVPPALLGVVLLATMLYLRQRRIAGERAEARQRQHERLAATVFATVDEAVMVTDADNRIIEVNPAFTVMTGYQPEEAIGSLPSRFASEKHPPEFFQRIREALAESGTWHGEVWNRHKDGRLYVVWLAVNRVCDDRGVFTHNVAAFSDITDRKQAEEAQLKAVLEVSPEAVLLVGEDGGIRFANRVCEPTFGYPLAELNGLSIDALVPSKSREGHARRRGDFMHCPHSRPMASGLKLTAQRKDGSEFPAEIGLSPIRMGEELLVITTVSDITQRIRDEEALRRSEERWKFALEGAGEGVWDWNIQSGETLFSKRILDFWGYAEGEIEDHMEEWTYRIHPDDRVASMVELQAHLDGKTASFAVEHRTACKDGGWKWALARGMVVSRDQEGQPLRMIGTYADISERKKIEQDFRDLLYFNQSVIANSHSGIMVHKAGGECILANEAAAWIAGTTSEQLLEHNFRESASWRESGELVAAEEALATGRTVEFESPMQTIYGKHIWCVASLGRLNLKGEYYLLSVFNDISARKEAELAVIKAKENAEALLDRARMAERRIIDISEETRKRIGQELHDDLGQHLTGVAFLSEVLFQKLKSQSRAEMEEAAKITEFINEAVSKTRTLAQGLYPVELKEAGLRALLGQTARNVEAIYGIRCLLTAPDNLDIEDFQTEINLFRIAQEAINNAVKHGGASEIRLTLDRCPGAIVFEIADDGCGIADPGRDLKISGLGMHTMHYRASLIGATLDIVGGDAGGTRVIITLPIV